MRSFFPILSLESILLFSPHALHASIFNGDFEAGSSGINVPAGATTIPGWSVTQGDVYVLSLSGYPHFSSPPTTAVNLNGFGSTLEQTVSTTPGQMYKLSFNWFPSSEGKGWQTMEVSWGGTLWDTAGYFQENVGDRVGGIRTSESVVYGTGSEVIQFRSTGTPGLYIDNVALVPVPEPSTYAVIFGAGLFGFAVVRRIRQTS
jgi:hypothetical protein